MKFKVKINSNEKLEDLLQEVYDDTMRQMNLINDNISELRNSTKLSDETVTLDMKAKYAKAMHDYTTDKEKAIARKMDVAKLLSEVIKFKGDIDKMLTDSEIVGNMDDMFSKIREDDVQPSQNNNDSDNSEHYITNITNYKNQKRLEKNKNKSEGL